MNSMRRMRSGQFVSRFRTPIAVLFVLFILFLSFSIALAPHALAEGEGGGEEAAPPITSPVVPSDKAGELKAEIRVWLNSLLKIIKYLGYFITTFGLGQILLAFKDDNLEAKSRGAMLLSVGLAIIFLPELFDSMGQALSG